MKTLNRIYTVIIYALPIWFIGSYAEVLYHQAHLEHIYSSFNLFEIFTKIF